MIFDSLITTHSSITHNAPSMEKIYIEQALKLLPTHVLSKIITEGWKIVVFSDVNELISIDSQLSTATTGVTEYEMRRVFVKGVTDGRNELSFKSTLLHELTHVFDCIVNGSYCNWKSEKYYNNELENLIAQEGSNFSEYAQSDVKEYLCTVVSRYILEQTDFTNIPLTKAFIEKYLYMSENSIEQRLQNLENNAVTYIEIDETYNRLKYSKLNKENDKYTIQLPQASSGGTSSDSGDNNVIYDNNVTFSTSVSYFSLNKTTISYINETLDSNTVGTWELKTIMGDSSAVAIQIRTFILNGRDSSVTDFTSLPNIQMRYFDYNNSRTWTSWVDKISSLETRMLALENNSSGSGTGNSTSKTLIQDYTVTEGTILNITALDTSTGQFTTDTDIDLSTVTSFVTPTKKEGIKYLLSSDIPTALQISSNLTLVDVVDNTFKLKNNTSYNITGDFSKYGLLVNGLSNYQVNNIFEANKSYEIEINTTQPYYNTALKLTSCVNNFNYQNGYVLGNEQYSTYLAHLLIPNCEGLNGVVHKIKLYNYTNSFKLEIESIFDGFNSNTAKYNFKKMMYFYDGNIMTHFSYSHLRNVISQGSNIKIYEVGGN